MIRRDLFYVVGCTNVVTSVLGKFCVCARCCKVYLIRLACVRRSVNTFVSHVDDTKLRTLRILADQLGLVDTCCFENCSEGTAIDGTRIFHTPTCANCLSLFLRRCEQPKAEWGNFTHIYHPSTDKQDERVVLDGQLINPHGYTDVWESETYPDYDTLTKNTTTIGGNTIRFHQDEYGKYQYEAIRWIYNGDTYYDLDQLGFVYADGTISELRVPHNQIEWSAEMNCYTNHILRQENVSVTMVHRERAIHMQYEPDSGLICSMTSDEKTAGTVYDVDMYGNTENYNVSAVVGDYERGRIEALAENLAKEAAEVSGVTIQPDVVYLSTLGGQHIAITAADMEKFRPINVDVRCDHCSRFVAVQFGTKKHHVCYECRNNRSRCQYCALGLHGGKSRWYAGAFVAYLSWIYGNMRKRVVDIFKKIFGFFYRNDNHEQVSSKLFVMMNNLTIEQGVDLGSKEFTDCFDASMRVLKTMTTKTVSCNHLALFSEKPENVGYNSGFFIIGQLQIPVTPCAKNCHLMEHTGVNWSNYKVFCSKYANAFRPIFVAAFDSLTDGNMEKNDIVMRSIPYFVRGTRRVEWTADAFDKQTERKWLVTLKTAWLNTAKFFRTNPTSSKLLIGIGIIGSIISGIAGLFGLYKLGKWVFSSGEQSSDRRLAQYASRPDRPPVKFPTFGGNVQQNQAQFEESFLMKLEKNSVAIEMIAENGASVFLRAMGVCGRTAMMPRHYYRSMKEFSITKQYRERKCGFKIYRPYFDSKNGGREYVFDEVDFVIADSMDFALFKLPAYTNTFCDIRSLFAKSNEFDNHLPAECELFISTDMRHSMQTRTVQVKGVVFDVPIRGAEKLECAIQHNYSRDGVCGAILYRQNATRPILGMHVAGSAITFFQPRGYCVCLSDEVFAKLENGFVTHAIDDYVANVEQAKFGFPEEVNVQPLCLSEKSAHMSSKTKIKPSLIHMYDGRLPDKSPAFLSKMEKDYPHQLSPLVLGCAKHGKLTRNFTTTQVENAGDAVWNSKYLPMKPLVAQPKRWSLVESIASISVEGYRTPLDLTTSAGYPFALTTKKQKQDYIVCTNPEEQELEKRVYEIDANCEEHLVEMEMMRENGIVPPLPYIDTLKDELKSLEKRKKPGGTRVFCVAPLSTTLADRQNFSHFVAAYNANRVGNLDHAVGISYDGPNWSMLANELLYVSNNIISLDYSNFGPGYNAAVCERANRIILDWTRKYVAGVNENELRVLAEEHFNSLHLAVDLIYRQLSGGPSGSALTVVRNGLVNELYIMLAWQALYVKQSNHLSSSMVGDFYKHVKLVSYGDDLLAAVSDEVRDWFNGVTITNFFAQYDIVATDASKNDTIKPYSKLTNCTFLKRGFVKHPKHPGEWMAPLDKTSLLETPRWIRNSPNDKYATWENAKQALLNAYGHGKPFFNKFREQLNAALLDAKCDLLVDTWDELDRTFFPMYYK